MTAWVPVLHISPLKRVDLYGPKPDHGQVDASCGAGVSPSEVDRIWKLVVQVAESSNAENAR